MQGVDAEAYDAFHRSNNLAAIVSHYATKAASAAGAPTLKRAHSVGVDALTPVKPMLAEAVSSFEVCAVID